MLVSQLNGIKLLLKPLNVFLFGHFHLLEDFFLSVQLTVEVFRPGDRLIDLVLEFHVLLLKYLNLAIGRVELDFTVFKRKYLVFEL